MVVAGLAVAFPFVDVDDAGVFHAGVVVVGVISAIFLAHFRTFYLSWRNTGDIYRCSAPAV